MHNAGVGYISYQGFSHPSIISLLLASVVLVLRLTHDFTHLGTVAVHMCEWVKGQCRTAGGRGKNSSGCFPCSLLKIL